jgi:folate-binding protein YgfZ
MSIFHSPLTDRAVLRIAGHDRVDFLQNLVTQDVARPQSGTCVMAALLTPQGKLLHDFFIYVETDALLIDCEAAQADALAKKLSLYKLRADVTVTPTALQIHALWQEDGLPCPPMSGFYQDPRHDGLGLRGFFDAAPDAGLPERPIDDWHMNRIKLGIPQGATEMPPGSVFPLEYGFADMQAIDFQKGCFVGQEVTSRTHRKGRLRKKLYPIVLSQAVGTNGDKLMAGDGHDDAQRVGGELVARHDIFGLALLREDAKDEKLILGDAEVEIQPRFS